MTTKRIRKSSQITELVGNLPVITIAGTPRAMGTALGTRLKARLQVLASDAITFIARHVDAENLIDKQGVPIEASVDSFLQHMLSESMKYLQNSDPSSWMELQALSQVSEVPILHLMAISAINDFADMGLPQQALFESNAVLISRDHRDNRQPSLALDWWVPQQFLSHVLLLRRIPAHGPATLSLTLNGMHTVAGVSAAGLAVGSNDLRELDDNSPGIPTTTLVSTLLNSITYQDALQKLPKLRPMGSRAMHLLDKQGQRITLELGRRNAFQLTDSNTQTPRVHTNHRLHPQSKKATGPAIDHSKHRLRRIAKLAISSSSVSVEDIDCWFAPDETQRHESRWRDNPQLIPSPAATLIFEPDNMCCYCHAGEAPGNIEQASL